LSPTDTLRTCATVNVDSFDDTTFELISFSREKIFTPIIVHAFLLQDEVMYLLHHFAFSPKIDRRSRSSGVSCVSPFGVILPTKNISWSYFCTNTNNTLLHQGYEALPSERLEYQEL
jgi:hypothetical protein